MIDAEGHVAAGGDSDTPFSIQSVSKVFTLTLALGKADDRLWRRVGREPSGSPFNSIVQLEFVAIAPGKGSIAVWSPGLDASGNSHLGQIALEMLTKRLGWSIFGT